MAKPATMTLLFLLHLAIFTMMITATTPPPPPPPRALVAPLNLDPKTSLYTFPALQAGRGVPNLLLDLSSPLVSFHCPRNYFNVPCDTPLCVFAHESTASDGCRMVTAFRHGACTVSLTNPLKPNIRSASNNLTSTNTFAFSATDGHHPTKTFTVSGMPAICTPSYFPNGIAGFSPKSKLSITALLADRSNILRQFAICLPSTPFAPGVIFFGAGPFYVLPPPGVDITAMLVKTRIIQDPSHPNDYFIPLKSIAFGLTRVAVNVGAKAKISTINPYTIMSDRIYTAFTKAFNKATSGIPRVPAISPFTVCMNSSQLGSTRLGPPVPQLDLDVGGSRNWTWFGSNLLKQVKNDVLCLAIVDGGKYAEFGVVIGSFQMQNSFVLFDLVKMKFGFTATLFGIRTTCQNFNFTASPN